MSDSARPGIVLCHGLWFDGSCFSRVIPLLQAAGYAPAFYEHALYGTAEGNMSTTAGTVYKQTL